MAKGVIYILTNPAFPKYVKIGYTKNLEQRLRNLNNSPSVPYAFRAYATYDVDSELTDKKLHQIIDKLNPSLRTKDTDSNGKTRTKEFFEMSASDAYDLLECIAKISGTTANLKRVSPDGHEAITPEEAHASTEGSRHSNFSFSACNIPIGAEVEYFQDSSIRAEVVDDRHVMYDGKTYSLTALAKQIRNTAAALQGPRFFKYEGEILTKRLARIERQSTGDDQ